MTEPKFVAGHNEGDPVRIITPEQLREGYIVQRGIGDPGDRHQYAVLGKTEDGNYIVREPRSG